MNDLHATPTPTCPPDLEQILELPEGVDPAWAVRTSHHTLPAPWERRRPGLIRAATHLHGPHQLQLTWHPGRPRRVELRIWGPAPEALAPLAAGMLGADDDGAGDFLPSDQPLARWHRRSPGLRLVCGLSVVETLVPIVLAQKILGKEAMAIQRRILRRLSTEAPGPPGLTLPPAVPALRELGYEDWHLAGLERRRVRTLHALLERAEALESWRDLPTERFYEQLVSLPGIGIWSANRLLYAFGHADAVWVGDVNLPSFVAWNLAGEPRADDARMLELLEPYRPHRARVLRLLEIHGSQPPRFGPRLAFRNLQQS